MKIELPEEEAQLFLWFREYQEIWNDAFTNLRPGSLVLHFNEAGQIGKREFHLYQNPKKKKVLLTGTRVISIIRRR